MNKIKKIKDKKGADASPLSSHPPKHCVKKAHGLIKARQSL